jgi:hypothetical protein
VTIRLLHGACESVLLALDADSIDACVTDPPYGLKFMGKKWDAGVPTVAQWVEVLRVLKPGAHLLAFGGTRTYHRLVCAIEDAGFEIRDQLAWIFGSGFPKSLNLEDDHEGWGSALKPAQEPIVLARKPIDGTIAGNMKAHGTGALNIEGCRIDSFTEADRANMAVSSRGAATDTHVGGFAGKGKHDMPASKLGRWPANVLHDGSDEVLKEFPSAPGQIADASSSSSSRKTQNVYGAMKRGNETSAKRRYTESGGTNFAALPGARRGDEGSAARFFYCAKASREDREDGLAHMAKRPLLWSSGTKSPGTFQAEGTDRSARNSHPTVKPTELMRYLCRLITPPPRHRPRPVHGQRLNGPRRFPRGLQLHRHRARRSVVADRRGADPCDRTVVR